MEGKEYQSNFQKKTKEEKRFQKQIKKHPRNWTHQHHYGMCGQNCPCCRKQNGEIFGICPICK